MHISENLKITNAKYLCSNSSLVLDSDNDCNILADMYHNTLARLLNKHAPLISKTVRVRPRVPWFNDDIKLAQRERRRRESKWKYTQPESDRQSFKFQRILVSQMLESAKAMYFQNKIEENANCSKSLFRLMHTLIGRQDGSKLCIMSCPDEVTDAFRKYFDSKIQIIHLNLDKARANMPETVDNDDPHSNHNLRLSTFEAASEAEVLGVINKSPAKSCGLDPIPTQLVKEHAVSLVPVITRLVNSSLNTGIVPTTFKSALLAPLLKKPPLDEDILKNYRPVSKYLRRLSSRDCSTS